MNLFNSFLALINYLKYMSYTVLLIEYLSGDYRAKVEFSIGEIWKSLKSELNAPRLRTHKSPDRVGGVKAQ